MDKTSTPTSPTQPDMHAIALAVLTAATALQNRNMDARAFAGVVTEASAAFRTAENALVHVALLSAAVLQARAHGEPEDALAAVGAAVATLGAEP